MLTLICNTFLLEKEFVKFLGSAESNPEPQKLVEAFQKIGTKYASVTNIVMP